MRRGLVLLYGFGVLICSSRGVFELLSSKIIGYLAQFGALVTLALMLVWRYYRPRMQSRKASLSHLLFWSIFLLSALSLALTVMFGKNSFEQAFVVWVPNILNIFFAAAAFQMAAEASELDSDPHLDRIFSWVIIGVSLYVSFLSILQYIGIVDFPGDALFAESVRLSGPLGSKQHLSLMMSIFCIILLSIVSRSPSVIAVIAFLISMLVLILSYTRIGYAVFFFTVIYWVFANFEKFVVSFFVTRRGMVLLAGGAIVAIALGNYFFDEMQIFIARVNTLESLDGSNMARIDAWRRGFDFFSNETTILISNAMGSASQIPKQLLAIDVYHYESGQIQYLINFGMLPTILINGLFVGWFLRSRRVGVTKALPLVMAAALAIYMFNEIVPIFVLFPLVAIEQRLSLRMKEKSTWRGHKTSFRQATV